MTAADGRGAAPDRRELLAMIAAVALAAPLRGHAMAGMQGPALPAVPAFAAPRRAALDRVAELIIPATDTGGARAAAVPQFIELMHGAWMTPAEQARCDAEIDIAVAVFERGGDPMDGLHEDGRFRLPMLRKLTIYGYYTSQIGAAEELDLNLVPATYEPCATLGPDDHAPSLYTWGVTLSLSGPANA